MVRWPRPPCHRRRVQERRWRRQSRNSNSAVGGGLGVLLLATALTLFVGCSEPPPPLRIGTNVWPGYEPLYLADQLGYFPDSALKLVEYLSASEVMRAFRNRNIDAAALTLDEVLVLLEHGIRVQVVLVTDISHGGDVILGKPGINRLGDLAGKRVGVEGTALGAYVLARALEKNELHLESLNVVQLEVSEHEAAFKRDEIDAAVTFEPVRSKLMAVGARELFSSREIPGEIVDVIVVHSESLEHQANRVAALIEGWFKALDYFKTEPEAAAERMSRRLNQTPQEVLRSYDGLQLPSRADNWALLGGEAPELLATLARLQQIMLKHELLQGPVSVDATLSAEHL